jgi:hypothetical protein
MFRSLFARTVVALMPATTAAAKGGDDPSKGTTEPPVHRDPTAEETAPVPEEVWVSEGGHDEAATPVAPPVTK